MSKKYDIFSKSDMKKFMSDMEKDLINAIQKDLNHYKCTHCHKSFQAHIGENICPHCNTKINLSFDN